MTLPEILPEYDDIIDDVMTLSPDGYYKFVFCHPLDFYRRRTRMIGAEGYDRVLDAGHGFGQWSVVLNDLNNEVIGVDRNEPRFRVSQILKSHYGHQTLDFRRLDIADIANEFHHASFDLVWAWSTIQFVDRELAMTAFNQVLRPNGTLILGGVNTSKKWLYKLLLGLRRGIRDKSYYRTCYKGFRGTEDERGANAIDFGTAARTAAKYGFELDAIAYDGEMRPTGTPPLYFEQTPLKIFQNIEMRLVKVRDV